jgi:hypothetical protein
VYQTVVLRFQSALKLTCEHLQILKFFWGLYPWTPVKGGREGILREGEREDRWGGMDRREREVGGGRNKEGKAKKKEREGTGVWKGREGGEETGGLRGIGKGN